MSLECLPIQIPIEPPNLNNTAEEVEGVLLLVLCCEEKLKAPRMMPKDSGCQADKEDEVEAVWMGHGVGWAE
jgi:hypothetical protein